MSKRSHEDSVFSKTARFLEERTPSTPGNSISINELLSNSEEPEADHSETHNSTRKPRNFIAAVACENCRLKKTRCDESRPKCGLCKALNLECVYSERKLSKKDQSIGMIISTLHRIETKLENLPSVISNDIRPITGHVLQAVEAIQVSAATAGTPSARTSSHKLSFSQNTSPAAMGQIEVEAQASVDGKEVISFSQHGVVVWPGIISSLPERFLVVYDQLGKNYVLDVELERSALPMWVNTPLGLPSTGSWLEGLPMALVKGLCEAFFSLFHPFTPFMDKHFFFSLTLGAVINHGFSTTIETCLVLNVMALGCLAVRAYEEADFPLPGTLGDRFERPAWYEVVMEDPPGLSFFNKARKRMGFLMEKNNLSSCQYYLLSAMYYTQIIRPLDSGAMLNRAAACLCFMLANRDINYNEWEGDMKSRVFWNTVMYETILVQELDLPPSGLLSLEDNVPIPKFIPFKISSEITPLPDPDDSYYHQCHFLAQIANRIILTRIRHSLYLFSESGTLPRPAVSQELHNQVEEWRKNLPPVIQFSAKDSTTTSNDDISPSITPNAPRTPTSLAMLVADSMLRARYRICKFHIGRPYLYKALRTPNLLTEDDFEQIRSGLRFAMDWPMIRGVFRQMRSCVPIRFAFCSQFFGQLLIFHCISNSPDPRLRATLPSGWERWYREMVEFLEYCAAFSPAISRDVGLIQLL
ncbi:C6 finger domain protein, putative [Talaromyces stipitatus ATCC 10500]|uniref:C6 finger domain protein, putative n=1 Tax=Talaromyces stipitatus (strain ATCC 10500 / CBS 375.48 / QM 6759 / NRRL 1006) TaxID=441959 RepID=B8MBQ0_TALSN|nr:C6 finger domain protein, putative [Talaromyces stipitatus ATCC 10500]EED18183.1 C6 finger domain protein, putative [Talaromyces stipitatus ATCC 10500]